MVVMGVSLYERSGLKTCRDLILGERHVAPQHEYLISHWKKQAVPGRWSSTDLAGYSAKNLPSLL